MRKWTGGKALLTYSVIALLFTGIGLLDLQAQGPAGETSYGTYQTPQTPRPTQGYQTPQAGRQIPASGYQNPPTTGGTPQTAPPNSNNWSPAFVPPSGVNPQGGTPGRPSLGPVPQPGVQPPTNAPFVLTPQQQAFLDQELARWEQFNASIEDFECGFYKYDRRGDGSEPIVYQGRLLFSSPDRGLFEIACQMERTEAGWLPAEESLTSVMEKWICDGESIFEFDFREQVISEYPISPEFQGQGISNGPLPFVFGAKADDLKSRYFLRITTPNDPKFQNQTWIEVLPRFRQDTSSFLRAEVILNRETMEPEGLRMFHLDGRDSTVYTFHNRQANPRQPLIQIPGTGPFDVKTPRDWTLVVKSIPGGAGDATPR
jgi:TIGR03009 family protein